MEHEEMVKAMVTALQKVKLVKTRAGYLIRLSEKQKPTMEYKDRLFKSQTEFTTAVTSVNTLRNAVKEILPFINGVGLQGRLMSKIYEIIKSDTVNEQPYRTVHHGFVHHFNGFNFNHLAALNSIFFAPFKKRFDRKAGTIHIDIPSFQPEIMLPPPEGATHFKIVTIGCEINFLDHTSITEYVETPEMPYTIRHTKPIVHTHHVTPGSQYHLLLLMNIRFYQYVNGEYFLCRNKKKNLLTILAVDRFEE